VHLLGLVLQHIQPTNRGRTTMNDSTIINFTGRDTITDPQTDLLRKGARELLRAAIEAERDAFLTCVGRPLRQSRRVLRVCA
jgi:hypothetical protein